MREKYQAKKKKNEVKNSHKWNELKFLKGRFNFLNKNNSPSCADC